MELEKLTEVAWYDSEGVFAIIGRWNRIYETITRKEDIDSQKLDPIGDAHIVNANGRTIPQIVEAVYESTLDNNPDVEIYKKINAFSIGNMLPDYPRDIPFNEKIVINFYQIKG